jgi:uncharacterized membrane protein
VNKARLEAFSDGVIAILITIMVLELKVPHGEDWAALKPLCPTFFSYALSFVFVGTYWNNHHHLLQLCTRINGRVMWANLHLLFWLSLIPFVTNWVAESHFASIPVAIYGAVQFASGLGYIVLQAALVGAEGREHSQLAVALGKDRKGKTSLLLFIGGSLIAFWRPWISELFYVGVALMWFVPDRRIERQAELRLDSDSPPTEG